MIDVTGFRITHRGTCAIGRAEDSTLDADYRRASGHDHDVRVSGGRVVVTGSRSALAGVTFTREATWAEVAVLTANGASDLPTRCTVTFPTSSIRARRFAQAPRGAVDYSPISVSLLPGLVAVRAAAAELAAEEAAALAELDAAAAARA